MNLIKKIKGFFQYLDQVEKYKVDLETRHNIRVDKIGRLYTVVNMPEDVITYGTTMSSHRISIYLKEYQNYFNDKNIAAALKKVEVIDELNYKIVFGFNSLNQLKIVNVFVISSLAIILNLLILLFFPIKMLGFSLLLSIVSIIFVEENSRN